MTIPSRFSVVPMAAIVAATAAFFSLHSLPGPQAAEKKPASKPAKPTKVTEEEEAQAEAHGDVTPTDKTAPGMVGTYVGKFGPHKITVAVEKVVDQTLLGYSIVTGNQRAFSGSWSHTSEGVQFAAKEPGDHPEDGAYTLTYQPLTKTLKGRWTPNDKTKSPVDLALTKKKFTYKANVGTYPQSSTKLLKSADVENLQPAELRLMRNEIYARHGYAFILKDMQEHFDEAAWYMPVAMDIQSKLTATEIKNAALIKRYEKYGEQYYDKFGR
jgi:hypothetical protein